MIRGEEVVISVESLYKRYFRIYALEDVGFIIKRNEHTLILGANGSGKSTLIRILSGLTKPTKGYVSVLGLNPFKNHHILCRRIGVLLDNHVLPWWMSGYEFLRFFSEIRGVDWKIIIELADMLGVRSYWFKKIFTYSEGMKKKIALIQALASARELLLLDDPFAFLDHRSRRIVVEILKELSNSNVTIMLTTHTLVKGLQNIFRKAIVLDNGRKVFEGPISETLRNFYLSMEVM